MQSARPRPTQILEDAARLTAKCAWCNDVSTWRYSVSPCVTALQRGVATFQRGVATLVPDGKHVSLVVGFRRLDLRSGSPIWLYGGGGPASYGR